MKLYDCNPAPSPRRVRIFLAEKGLDIPLVQIELGSGQQFAESFRRINPLCEVPALELDDGTIITESVAICRYLEEIHPEPPLFGRTPRERAEISMWDHRVEVEGFFPVAEMFRNKARGFHNRALPGPHEFAQIPELVERGRKRVALFYDTLEERLSRSPFIGGADFSVADITAIVCVDFATRAKAPMPETYRHLQNWYRLVSARPSMMA